MEKKQLLESTDIEVNLKFNEEQLYVESNVDSFTQ